MHFSTLVTSALAAAAAAAPKNAVSQKLQRNPDQIAFAAQADECPILSCTAAIASAGCIAAGIASDAVPAVLGCIAGGSSQLCKCVPRVDALEDFLTSNGLCSS
ncbi:hypothetical protein B0J12DRAFT_777695 [Macrophomina phaseolina]|uniref:Uncharacterized protein n=1 Tax=Macrophomina phaseolina TaxID=35725 RepID=A0ABQ8GFH6_9PEZI|nr:hypothetical protein B0J12DRAFT_777695 [Macrophomina phaseolina]